MEEFNKTTLDAYNKEVDQYISHTPSTHKDYHVALLRWIDAALSGLSVNSKILEIGSATPRDATYMRQKGYTVQTSDGAPKFVENLKRNGEAAIQFNVLVDPVPFVADLFIANAVAPHFTKENMYVFLRKLHGSLTAKGRIALNVKLGEGEEWITEKFNSKRFIHYWNADDIKSLVSKEGFTILFAEFNAKGDLPTHKWLNLVVEKSS